MLYPTSFGPYVFAFCLLTLGATTPLSAQPTTDAAVASYEPTEMPTGPRYKNHRRAALPDLRLRRGRLPRRLVGAAYKNQRFRRRPPRVARFKRRR